jgi:serine/threonine protein kinase
VHLAHYVPRNEKVAIKMVDMDLFAPRQIDELRKELQIMNLCRHLNVLPVLQSFICESKLCIVTPVMSAGQWLNVLVTLGPFAFTETQCLYCRLVPRYTERQFQWVGRAYHSMVSQAFGRNLIYNRVE